MIISNLTDWSLAKGCFYFNIKKRKAPLRHYDEKHSQNLTNAYMLFPQAGRKSLADPNCSHHRVRKLSLTSSRPSDTSKMLWWISPHQKQSSVTVPSFVSSTCFCRPLYIVQVPLVLPKLTHRGRDSRLLGVARAVWQWDIGSGSFGSCGLGDGASGGSDLFPHIPEMWLGSGEFGGLGQRLELLVMFPGSFLSSFCCVVESFIILRHWRH